MKGPHDLGGDAGHGPIPIDKREPRDYEAWEKRAVVMTLACIIQGVFSLDAYRYARERMSARAYFGSRYYEQWVAALETCLVECGLLDLERHDQRSGTMADGCAEVPSAGNRAVATRLRASIVTGASAARSISAQPRFAAGQFVRVIRGAPIAHTRLPRYARGCRGVVTRVAGAFVLPDSNALGLGESPEYVYQLRFSAREVWGPSGGDHDELYLDLWESYLDVDSP